MKTTSYSPTHEFKATCPYCGQVVRLQVNLRSSTTDGGTSTSCKHTDGTSNSPSGKFITFQDDANRTHSPRLAAYLYVKAQVSRLGGAR
jgi:hypothetical protein